VSDRREVSQPGIALSRGLEASLDPYVVVRALRDATGAIVDFSYVDLSERACASLGRTREEILAVTMRELLPAEFASQLVIWLGNVVETGVAAERLDVPFINSGTKEVGRLDVRAVSDGDLVGYTFRDLGETRDIVDRYRLLLENSSDIVVRTSREGVIEWIFDAVADVLGYRPEELTGTLLSDLMHPDDVAARLQIRERIVSEEMVRFRLRIRGKDGLYHAFGAVAHRVLGSDGTPQGVIAGLHLLDAVVAIEEAAREVEERYRLMATYGTDVVSLERRGVVEWVSPYLEQLLGLTSEDVLGRALTELVHPDDRRSLQNFHRAVEGTDTMTLTLRMRMADASYRWVSMRSREVYDDASREQVRVSSWRDAQSDVAAQRALVASESRFRLLAENSTDVVIECDDKGVVHWVSPSAQATLGWRSDLIVGSRLQDHVFSDDMGRVEQQQSEIAARERARSVEVRYLTPTGNVKWMSQQMRQVRGTSDERRVVIVGLHDIDDEVTARFVAAETEARFRLLADNVTDVVYNVNFEGELIWVSPSVVDQLGWQVADMLGHSVLDLVYPEDRSRVIAWRQLLHFGEILDELTLRVRHASGSFVWMKARAQPTRDSDGRITGVVTALRNCDAEIITARALRTISAGSRILVREVDPAEMLHQMCQVAVDEGGYLLAWYGRRVDDEKKSVEVLAHSLGNESYLENLTTSWGDNDLGQGPTGRAIRLGQTCTSADIDTDVAFRPWRESALEHGFHSAASVPVVVNGQIDGAWQVYALEPRAFTPEVLAVLEDMALEIGYGLARTNT
jgi:PAS domain S-box-containing protein